ncbi:SIS domain-containing protein [Xanthobacteraceae bacterium Astr-EGSB]|uniref:SIS domain-containing protein n=1 Tax=Astrobacterium formosum TaxID=3069710 RepID=UPI0027B36D15|nr:SIS domain-containing protein [Xanthobacteraceae bacterium Astr-EGSB]
MSIEAFIREQPETIARCVAAAESFAATWRPSATGIALVGSGSSFNALTAARPSFVAARRGPVVVYDPEDFVAELPLLTDRPLVIVLSQSGGSTTSIAAARAAVAARLPTLAVTATADAPIAAAEAELFVMPIGDEPVGPKTKGFTGSLATLLALAQALGAPEMPPPADDLWATAIAAAHGMATILVPNLTTVDMLTFAGRRALYGIALEASLKITEIAGVPTAAVPTEELLHGRLHGLTAQSRAFLLVDGDSEATEARRIAAVMLRHGCRVDVVDAGTCRGGGASTPWGALGVVLPFQWLAVMMAQQRGLVPETMRYGALSAELAIKATTQP